MAGWDDKLVGLVDVGSPDGPVPVVWSEPEIGEQIVAALKALVPTATEVVEALWEPAGHDSFDREGAFSLAEQQFGIPYNEIYDAWLAHP